VCRCVCRKQGGSNATSDGASRDDAWRGVVVVVEVKGVDVQPRPETGQSRAGTVVQTQ
jgi:hypothetical protein